MDSKVQNGGMKQDLDLDNKLEEPKERPKVVWLNVFAFAFLHLMGLYSFYIIFTGRSKLITTIYIILYGVLIGGLGVTLGAHRLWSHRSYKAKLPLKLILLYGQTQAGQNSLWTWVRDHRAHHKFSDTDADPHNSRRGFFFSHMGWLMMKKHPEVVRKGKLVDMSDLNADPWIMFQKKYYVPLHLLNTFAIPAAIPYFFWNESLWYSVLVAYFFRMVVQLHITWSVNSFAHFYGNKPYDKEIIPVQNPYVSFFALGEGWHNFHHTFPWDCSTSEFGQHFNLSTRVLSILAKLGLAYDLKIATKEMIMNRVMKHGDGTHLWNKSID